MRYYAPNFMCFFGLAKYSGKFQKFDQLWKQKFKNILDIRFEKNHFLDFWGPSRNVLSQKWLHHYQC